MRVVFAVGKPHDVSWLAPAALAIAPARSSFVVVPAADRWAQDYRVFDLTEAKIPAGEAAIAVTA